MKVELSGRSYSLNNSNHQKIEMNQKLKCLLALAACLLPMAAPANDIEPGKKFYTAIKATKPIVIDGNLSEWTGANVIADPRFYTPKGSGSVVPPSGTLVNFEPYDGGTWSGPDDQTSSVRVVYDDENVYFGFVVTDDYHENAANSAWNGDSVQLMVASADRTSQVALYNYALGGVEASLGAVIVNHEAGPGGTTAVVTRDTVTKKTTYEIKLPKAALALETLGGGVKFGLGMAINDGDAGPGQNGQKGWGGLGAHSIVFGKTPLETALVTLAAPPPPRVQNNDIEPGKEFYTAIKAAAPIVMDGDLGEWRGAQLLADPRFSTPKGSKATGELINFEPYQGGTWSGPDDQTSAVRVVYDDENVYFGFVVTDDYHENAANSAWNGDSIQLMVANAPRDAQIALYNYALGGTEAALGSIIVNHEAGPGGTNAVIRRNTVTKRTTYEIQLPKAALALEELKGGVQFGLGMAINDGDAGAGQNGQKGWGGLGAHAIVFGKTPSECALVTLATANDIEPGKEFYFAAPTLGPIELDGSLGDWSGISVLSDPRFAIPKGSGSRGAAPNLKLFEEYQGGTWAGPDDQTSAVRIAYDANNVYFAFVVTDDYHENAANSAWNGDSIQLMVANAKQDAQVALYNYAQGGTEAVLGNVIVMHEAGPGGTSAVVNRDIATKRTTYEIKLPKASLGVEELKLGTMFGLGMAINDGDNGAGQNGQKGWGGLGAHALVFGKSPGQTALVTLGLGGNTVPCFVSAISTPVSASKNKFTFRGNDFEGCVVNPTTTTLLIDGQPAALVASPKVQGATDFTHTLTSVFAAGSEHSFVIELRDTNGGIATERGTFTMATPILPRTNLPTPPIAPGLWATRYIFNAGNVDSLTAALNIIKSIGTPDFTGNSVNGTSEVLNHGNGGIFGEPVPYDAVAEADGCCGDDFILLSAGMINITKPGRYTFGVHSDDGFVLRIRGASIVSSSGGGQVDIADPETIMFAGPTGDSNTRAVYEFAAAGEYRVEFLWFEDGGGDNGELYAVEGSFTNDEDTASWALVGRINPGGSYDKLGVDSTGWSVVSSDPGGDQLIDWPTALADLAATSGPAKVYDGLLVGDPDTNAGVAAFPKDAAGGQDDFALKATAKLVVPKTGVYRIQFNTDDGGYVKIAGQVFTSIIQSDQNRAEIAPPDTVTNDVLSGDSNTIAEITLNAGTYNIEAGMFERGGGAFLRLRGAAVNAPSFLPYPTLTKNAAGSVTYPPSGVVLVPPPASAITDSISSITTSGNNLVISFKPTNPALVYKLSSTTNLLNWTTLNDIPVIVNGIVTFTTPKPAGQPRVHYRIVK